MEIGGKYAKIIISVLLVIIIGLCGGITVQQYKLGSLRCQFELTRNRLEYAQDQQRLYEQTIGDLRTSVGRTNQILSKSTTTIQGIREQISQIKQQYEQMERLLNHINSSDSGINNRAGNSSEEVSDENKG